MSSLRLQTLNEWFSASARKPFIAILSLLVAAQVSAYFVHVYRSYLVAEDMSQLLGSIYELGVLQSNRLLIEKVTALSVVYDFKEVRLCEGEKLLYSSGTSDKMDCNIVEGFFDKLISVPLLDSNEKVAYFVYPYFKEYFSSLLFMLAPSLLFFIVVTRLQVILGRIKKDLVDPLVRSIKFVDKDDDEVRSGNFFNVAELNELFQSYRLKMAELKAAVDKQAQLDKQAAIGRVIGQLSHDMRAPINSMERLLSVDPNLPIASQFEIIRSSLRRLNSMIDSLRHADAELLVLPKKEEFNFTSGLNMIESIAYMKGLSLTFPDYETRELMVDKQKFERALINLYMNAIDAARSFVRVEVEESAFTLIRVIDDGQGVDPFIVDSLFQRGTTHGKHGGTGLGLAYVKQIMQGHGGDVFYRRENGLTIFECHLPNPLLPEEKAVQISFQKIDSDYHAEPRLVSICVNPPLLANAILAELTSRNSTKFKFNGNYAKGVTDIMVTNDPGVAARIIEDDGVVEIAEYQPAMAPDTLKARIVRRYLGV